MAEVPEVEGYSDLVRVAKGGFGAVYRARQDRFGRVVALKVLNVADLDARGQRRFERECVAMGSLGWHPNVVAVFDSGIAEDGHPYLVMEFLDGGSLGDRLATGPIPWREVVVAGVQVAGALGAAHAAGTLHRDLKPENLLVGPFGEIKLGDFGIAAVEGATRTTTGHASFTAHHVAPEILRRQRPSERTDLYSLGSTLHTLITGSPPFAGEPDEPIEAIITSVLTDGPPRLSAVPDGLADLLARTLSKDPAARPESALQFGQTLQGIQAEAGERITDLRLTPKQWRGAAGTSVAEVEAAPKPDPASEPDLRASGDALPTVELRIAEVPGDGPDPHNLDTVVQPDRAAGDSLPTIDLLGAASVGGDPRTPLNGPLPEPEPEPSEPPPRSPPAVAEPPPRLDRGGDDTHTTPAGADGQSGRGRQSRGWLRISVTLVALTTVGVVVAAALLVTRHDTGSTSSPPRTSTSTTAPPEVAATIDLGSGIIEADGVSATDDAVWVTDELQTLTRVDPATDSVTASIDVGNLPAQVAATDAGVWVADTGTTLTRVDPATDAVTATIDVGTYPHGVAASPSAVWVTNGGDDTVMRIDPETNGVTATIPVGDNPVAVAATETAVWVTNRDDDTVSRIDPTSDAVSATIEVGRMPGGVAATDTAAWISNFGGGKVSRIDPSTNTVAATIDPETEPNAGGAGLAAPNDIAASSSAVWVANFWEGTVTCIDVATNTVSATVEVPGSPVGVAATDSVVWVTDQDGASVSRIDTGT